MAVNSSLSLRSFLCWRQILTKTDFLTQTLVPLSSKFSQPDIVWYQQDIVSRGHFVWLTQHQLPSLTISSAFFWCLYHDLSMTMMPITSPLDSRSDITLSPHFEPILRLGLSSWVWFKELLAFIKCQHLISFLFEAIGMLGPSKWAWIEKVDRLAICSKLVGKFLEVILSPLQYRSSTSSSSCNLSAWALRSVVCFPCHEVYFMPHALLAASFTLYHVLS